jgi:hypothetical protein
MVDRLSGPARSAKQQAEALTAKLGEQARELKRLEAEYKALNDSEVVNIGTARKLQKQIEAKKDAISKTADKIRGMVKAEEQAASATNQTAQAATAGAPQVAGFGGELAALAPIALAVAAALLAVGAAIIAGAKLAIEASAFKRQTIAALRDVTKTGAEAQATFEYIRKISDEIGISEAKAQKLGLSLLDAGVAQADLGDTIKAIAVLEKTRGEQAAGKLEELIKKSAAAGALKLEGESLVGTGLSKADVVGQLAKQLRKSETEVEAALKDNKITAQQGIAAISAALKGKGGVTGITTLAEAADKGREKLARLFEDVDPGPFFAMLQDTLQLFDESTSSGKALKWLATTIFDGLFAISKEVFPYIKTAFLEIVIVALKAYIAAKPVVKEFEKLKKAFSDAMGGGEGLSSAITFLIDALGVVIRMNIYFIGGMLLLWTTGVRVWSGLAGVISAAWESIKSAAQAAWDWLKGIFSGEGGGSIAMDLINGLIGGVLGGGPKLLTAMMDMAKGAVDGVKKVLGIASPSKVFAELGAHTAAGFAQGVDDGSGGAQNAVADMVAPPAAKGGGAGGAVSIDVGGITVQIMGGANVSPSQLAEELESRLADIFERLALRLGSGPTPEGT